MNRLFQSETNKYTAYGVVLGFLFLVIATTLIGYLENGVVHLRHMFTLQASSPLVWLIDTTPLIFGLLARWVGSRQDHLQNVIDNLNGIINEQRVKLQQSEMAVQEASKAKEQFLANMSHEIRTPLNAVLGMASLLLDGDLNAEQRDYVETIYNSGNKLLFTVTDILDFAAIEAGTLKLIEQPIALHICIENALDLVTMEAAQKGLELGYIIATDLPGTLIGDGERLQQILINLVSNAVKFTQEGEVFIFVDGRRAKNGLYEYHFAVKDTGVGNSSERFDRLFNSLSQGEASSTRNYSGTGLGIIISRRLSELMGGRTWVESDYTKGAIFHFTIMAKPASEQEEIQFADNHNELEKLSVLIVDDNDTSRIILRKQLMAWNITAKAVGSGEEALLWFERGKTCNLVILDMQMPYMDGRELVREIRKRFPPAQLSLIMMTSIRFQDTLPEEDALIGSLTKPIKPALLYETLVKAIPANLTAASKHMPAKTEFDNELGQKHSLTILLAEDDFVNQKVTLHLLEKIGYLADVANNGVEVLEALKRQLYDVVIMDIQMPEMDGVMVTQRIRETLPSSQQPRIIAMTANALPGDKDKYLSAGLDDYISKPIRIEELTEALHRCQALISASSNEV